MSEAVGRSLSLFDGNKIIGGGAAAAALCGVTALLFTGDTAGAEEAFDINVSGGTELSSKGTLPIGKIINDNPQFDTWVKFSDDFSDGNANANIALRVGTDFEEWNKLNISGRGSYDLNEFFTAHGGSVLYTTPGIDGQNIEGWVGVTSHLSENSTIDLSIFRGRYFGESASFVEAVGTKSIPLNDDTVLKFGALAGQNIDGPADTAYWNISAAIARGDVAVKAMVFREGDNVDATIRLVFTK